MEILSSLLRGFSISFQPVNILHCFIGVTVGTAVGVLPGLGTIASLCLILPITLHLSSATSALIMMAGVYYGTKYGGSTTSILLNIPGEAASVITCLDGYQMARKGKAGAALGISAFGSFIAGTAGVVGLMLMAPPLAVFALRFGPPEYACLMLCGIAMLSFIGSGSMPKALMMAGLGLMLGSVGMDRVTGYYRFTYNLMSLDDGLGLIPMTMGYFGIAEVLTNIEQSVTREVFEKRIRGLLPSLQDWKDSIGAISRGSVIGFFLGILPGGGPLISSFISYGVEKRVSKHPERFGQGEIAGVAGPESANNSAACSGFVPMLSLGIPTCPVIALLLGVIIMYGLEPGPLLIKRAPDVFWGLISSMYTANVMLLILNLPLIPIWVKLLKIPYRFLFPSILLFCLIGAYSNTNSVADVIIMNIFGVLGYLMRKLDYEGAPFMLAFIIGPLFETALRQSLIMSHGSFMIFVTRPISLVCLLVAVALLCSPLFLRRRIVAELED